VNTYFHSSTAFGPRRERKEIYFGNQAAFCSWCGSLEFSFVGGAISLGYVPSVTANPSLPTCDPILFCRVAQAELKGCHHGIYSFGDHFQKQGHLFAFRLGFGKVAK
jgi:hypothetical protein